ncbi:hypothetical protein BP6252_13286 [Coleophoma cylindrospora]|uniref:Uncharacterized protein n=1 Tax=Coleophoma cylindrospora TaxID=1849047 RepID=A0A3D8QAY3_9HELO|nr:hypothetical protein BP6252_13286 [Coleophoma cylindrospora]
MVCLDNTFGPVINHGCRAAFDFTLLFEQTILSSAPSALFLLIAPFNYLWLGRGAKKVRQSFLYQLKLSSVDHVSSFLEIPKLTLTTWISAA